MITLNKISIRHRNTSLVSSATAVFASSSVTYLAGGNGAGKSSLLRAIAGVQTYRGEILFDGQPRKRIRSQLWMAFDDSATHLNSTGRQNIDLLLSPNRALDVLPTFDGLLDDTILNKRARQLSNGQLKRLHLAIAFLSQPRFLFLDEALNGIDESILPIALEAVRAIASTATVIVTGHDRELYQSIADTTIILESGRLLREGSDLLEGV